MAKTRGEARADRLQQMEELYLLRAYTDIEMAERLQVNRETVFKDRQLLMAKRDFEEIERGRWKIKRTTYISNIGLNPFESLPLYLFARKSARQLGIAQPHVVRALEKLALCLRQPMAAKLAQSAERVLEQPEREQQVKVFEQIAQAWVEHRRVDIDYIRLDGSREVRHTLDPYLIEPSVWSDSVYAIGRSEPDRKIMPFKLDRIVYAFVRGETFPMPDEFDERELLKHAWGIWTAENEPKWVRLKFTNPTAIRRLKESVWHPLEEECELPDGSWEWAAPVAEWREMLPWVRGWGSSCEVSAPDEMKEELRREVKRLARLYHVMPDAQSDPLMRVLRCWGKTTSDVQRFHPALFHMLDVGHIAQMLLSEDASSRWRSALSKSLCASTLELANWLPWVIAMHDIGKLSACFQSQNPSQKIRLESEGFSFKGWRDNLYVPHATISQTWLSQALQQQQLNGFIPAISEAMMTSWCDMLGGHHGEFVTRDVVKETHSKLKWNETAEWAELRLIAARWLKDKLWVAGGEITPPQHLSAAVAALTGFAILCDWLGSDGQHFRPEPDADPEDYIGLSRQCARQAVESAGFFQRSVSASQTHVSALFPHLHPLRPLQLAIDEIPDELLQSPCLAIIEAPTGEGKTEAALALAHRIAKHVGSDELYYALPTMATSNQMFGRVQTYLRDSLKLDIQVKLIHGQAFLVEDDLRIEPLNNGDEDSGNSRDSQVKAALEWFGPKKRALLAPFGVGTIDQAELAALNVRHTALRLAGLSGKVVILDEVHAYDTYMTTIIEQLLRWLSSLGTSVILLSATLPLARRSRLAEAYGVALPQSSSDAPYPSLLVMSQRAINQLADNVSPISHEASPQAWQPARMLDVQTFYLPDDDPNAKARWLMQQIEQGGCASWITNTVKRAQDLYETLDEMCGNSDEDSDEDMDVMLLHAQMPLDERQERERQLAAKYGREGQRPARGIVIGTQVLEQSLDLDFDAMASDLAPIDLLLQRAGRLHRHSRPRPARHEVARLHVWSVLAADEYASLGADMRIYAEYVLRRTWQTMVKETQIKLPHDYRPLIEAVYHEAEPDDADPLKPAWRKLQAKQSNEQGEAHLRLLPDPDPDWSFAGKAAQKTFEERENGDDWIVAQTRLGQETITVIPLWVTSDDSTVHLSGIGPISLNHEAPRETQLAMLRRSIRVSQFVAVQALKASAAALPKLFSRSALLKDCLPLLLTDGQTTLPFEDKRVTFKLDARLGLRIVNTKRESGEPLEDE